MKEETQKLLDMQSDALKKQRDTTGLILEQISNIVSSGGPLPDDLNNMVLADILIQLISVNQFLAEINANTYQINDQLESIEFNTRGGTYPEPPPELTH